MRRSRLAIAISVFVGILIYFLAALMGDIQAIGRQALSISWDVWFIILLTSCLNYGLRFVRWDWFIRRFGSRIPILDHSLIYLAGFALTTTPGKAGEGVRTLYMRRYGVPVQIGLASLFVERLMDLISVTALAFLAFAAVTNPEWVMGFGVFLIVTILALFRSQYLERMSKFASGYFLKNVLKEAFAHLAEMFISSRKLLAFTPFILGNAVGLVAWAAEGFGFYILVNALGLDVGLAVAIGIYTFSVLVGALSFLPGGLGSTDAVMVALLVASGSDVSTAVLATIVCRLLTLWFAVALGLVSTALVVRLRSADCGEGGEHGNA